MPETMPIGSSSEEHAEPSSERAGRATATWQGWTLGAVALVVAGFIVVPLFNANRTVTTAATTSSTHPVDDMTWLQEAGIDRSLAEQIAANAVQYHDTIYTLPFTDEQLWIHASGAAQNCWDVAAGKITWPQIVQEMNVEDLTNGSSQTSVDAQDMTDFERTAVCPVLRAEPTN